MVNHLILFIPDKFQEVIFFKDYVVVQPILGNEKISLNMIAKKCLYLK